MTAAPDGGDIGRRAAGADLVIPALAVAFTLYYISTIWDLSWEAKADGLAIGAILLGLIGILLVRIWAQVVQGEASLALDALTVPRRPQLLRLALAAAIVVFILILPYLGFTPAMLLFMCGAMVILGVRSPRAILLVASGVALGGYLLFIALLDTRFPRGPVERLLGRLF